MMLIAVALQGIRNKYLILMKVYALIALFTFLRGRSKVNQNELLHGHLIASFGAPSQTQIFEDSRNVFNSVRFLRRKRKVNQKYWQNRVCLSHIQRKMYVLFPDFYAEGKRSTKVNCVHLQKKEVSHLNY